MFPSAPQLTTEHLADNAPSYAEMEKSEKNHISHRYKALVKLQDWFMTERSS